MKLYYNQQKKFDKKISPVSKWKITIYNAFKCKFKHNHQEIISIKKFFLFFINNFITILLNT